jgi:hypothetical protein
MPEISEKELERFKAIEKAAQEVFRSCGNAGAIRQLGIAFEPVSLRPTIKELHRAHWDGRSVAGDKGLCRAAILVLRRLNEDMESNNVYERTYCVRRIAEWIKEYKEDLDA